MIPSSFARHERLIHVLTFKAQAMLKILLPEQPLAIMYSANNTFTQIGIQIMSIHRSLLRCKMHSTENLSGPVFICSLSATKYHFKNTIFACIILPHYCNSNAHD